MGRPGLLHCTPTIAIRVGGDRAYCIAPLPLQFAFLSNLHLIPAIVGAQCNKPGPPLHAYLHELGKDVDDDGGEQEAVDAVEHAAVSWHNLPTIFDVCLAFDE
jgi:hypothetical protein